MKFLCTFVDSDGLTRLRSKIVRREDECNGYPILLISKHKLVEILIQDYHVKNSHAGVQILLRKLRERYWILGGRNTVCRVNDASVFEVCGVDMAGPLYLKGGEKAWILLFTCAVYRVVHFELVLSLFTGVFLKGLWRFIARWGRSRVMYSDNRTNFIEGDNRRRVLFPKIARKCIPPTAAWWGGWWEQIVQMVKNLLRRTLGSASLEYEEVSTILCEVESVINSRHLTCLRIPRTWYH
ncbi:hypothetical protein PR048_022411 [Dryococelus australis]|uniref:Integrase zinc-binding domain-containing protein n=1 Tax=Dryococelus australis TaxID=614101 RepID=A0ABQ9H0Y2_9NEOP|nr:hypothetical protein PR048_022411 [Dryococelus australis]